jgi:hypothetical protein
VRSTLSGLPRGLSSLDSATHWGAAKTLLSACRSRLSIFFGLRLLEGGRRGGRERIRLAVVPGRFIGLGT